MPVNRAAAAARTTGFVNIAIHGTLRGALVHLSLGDLSSELFDCTSDRSVDSAEVEDTDDDALDVSPSELLQV